MAEAAAATPGPRGDALLSIRYLTVRFHTGAGLLTAVDNVSFDVAPGEVVGIVGESGSGKSQMFLALGHLNASNAVVTGSARFAGHELLGLGEDALNRLRGKEFAYIFQDPMTSLNPFRTVGSHLTEMLRFHRGMTRAEARAEALRLLELVRIPDASRRFRMYPHELSGGMRQRVVIAMALSCSPKLIIADEPTTALDVTVQLQVLDILDDLRREIGLSVILITHDMGVVARLSDQVKVVYAGRIIEEGPTAAVLGAPTHPYTAGLLASTPEINRRDKVLKPIGGQPHNPGQSRQGCLFAPRCARSAPVCLEQTPVLAGPGGPHRQACHFPLSAPAEAVAP